MGGLGKEIAVHIDEALYHPWFYVVRKVTRGIEGVQEVDLRNQSPHIMLVKYDPERTSSRSIQDELSYIGYHTQLIGL